MGDGVFSCRVEFCYSFFKDGLLCVDEFFKNMVVFMSLKLCRGLKCY